MASETKATHVEALPPPELHLPSSSNTVNVRIIDTTSAISCKTDIFLSPIVGGMDEIHTNAFSFLVENPRTGQKLVFDLGVRKDWQNLATPMVEGLLAMGFRIHVEKGVSEILQDGHVALEDIDAIIWSHWHFDHIGDPSTFPTTTQLIVGPGTSAAKLPPWPENPASTLTEGDIRGRDVREIASAEFNLQIGRFRALDYFNDGSFYLLDVPGHAIGHICGFARTTENSFILMGADTCHHSGQYRPSPYLPLPENIKPHPHSNRNGKRYKGGCPCSVFEDIHPNPTEYRTQQFYTIRVGENGSSIAHDVQEAKNSIEGLQEFDAADNVFVVCAHDASLPGIIDVFPQYANAWKDHEWKERGRWRFLGDWKIPMFEARLEQAGLLKRVVDAIKDLVQDCNFDCNDSGIALQAMDNSHVALVSMMMNAEAFSPYRCDRTVALGINLVSLTKVLRAAQNEDILTLKAEDSPDVVNLMFESAETDRLAEYDLKLMDIDQEHLAIPETDYSATVSMPSGEFQRICRDLNALSESVVIEATKEGIKFSCQGDIGNGAVTVRQHTNVDKPDNNVSIHLSEPVALTFSLKYLVNFCKATALAPQVKLCLSQEVPLQVEYNLSPGHLRFFLAPKIGDEE